ncbi:MAG: glycosyltransferase family 4 protein [Candidatus Neomarinimicrobiota bacterium]
MSKKTTLVAFVTNFCQHYRIKTFEMLAKFVDVRFYFFSRGEEWYWPQQHGVSRGKFNYEYLRGFELFGTRITPGIIPRLFCGKYDIFLSGIVGRFAMPITFILANIRRKPFILWTGIWMRLQTPFHRIFFPVTRHIYRHADAIVVYGEHVKRYLINEGVCEERIFVARHAVDNSKFNIQVPDNELHALRKKLNIKPDQKMILYLGRLEAVKGLPCLIEAFASLKSRDTILVIAGTGSQSPYLKQFAKEKGVADKIRFPGYVRQEDSVVYYASAFAFVLPSITTPNFKEPWGLVVNEAFNQGLPVIATEAVGAAVGGLVQDEVNGLVVPERDSAALTHALERILKDPELRERLSVAARTTIEGWRNEHMVEGFRNAIAYTKRVRRKGL